MRWSKVLVLGDEQVATSSSSSSSSSFDGLPRVCLAWQTAPTGCAVGFVREYYADLKRNDGTAAAKKWNSIGTERIEGMLAAIEGSDLQNLTLLSANEKGGIPRRVGDSGLRK